MKMLTKEIIKYAEKYPLGSQDNTPVGEMVVICKFFNPYGIGTWIVTEMSKEDDDWLMFGIVSLGGDYELGYISFNELDSIRVGVFGHKLPLERDLSVTPGKYKVKDLI